MDVSFDVSGTPYTLPQAQATLLAENLRGHAAVNFPKDDQLIARLGAAPGWGEGALAMADAIEDVLTGSSEAHIGLDRGRGAAATYWVLRLMMDLQPDPQGAAGLKEALEGLLSDYELDEHILAELRQRREAVARGESADGSLTSATLADRLQVRVEDIQDRLHHLALEGRVKESEARPIAGSSLYRPTNHLGERPPSEPLIAAIGQGLGRETRWRRERGGGPFRSLTQGTASPS